MSSNVAANRTDVINHTVSIGVISIVVASLLAGVIYFLGGKVALPLQTTPENGAYLFMGIGFGLAALGAVKINLNQGDLTKMDAFLLTAIAVVGTGTYVVVTEGTLFTGIYLSLAVAFVVRLALIVVAHDIICAIRPD